MLLYVKPLASTTGGNHIDKIQDLINQLFSSSTAVAKQTSNQVVEDASRIAKEARWNKTLARCYCNEINAIFDSFEKNRDIPSNQLQIAFRSALRTIESALLTGKYALNAFPSLQLTYGAKHKKTDMLLDSFTIVEQKYRDLKQVFEDLRYAKEDNILNSRFRAHLDDSVSKAVHLTKIAYKLSNNCVTFLKRTC